MEAYNVPPEALDKLLNPFVLSIFKWWGFGFFAFSFSTLGIAEFGNTAVRKFTLAFSIAFSFVGMYITWTSNIPGAEYFLHVKVLPAKQLSGIYFNIGLNCFNGLLAAVALAMGEKSAEAREKIT